MVRKQDGCEVNNWDVAMRMWIDYGPLRENEAFTTGLSH
jgi:hypothetical protein